MRKRRLVLFLTEWSHLLVNNSKVYQLRKKSLMKRHFDYLNFACKVSKYSRHINAKAFAHFKEVLVKNSFLSLQTYQKNKAANRKFLSELQNQKQVQNKKLVFETLKAFTRM